MNRLFSLVVKLSLMSMVLAACSVPLRRIERPKWLEQIEEVHGKLVTGEIIEVGGRRVIGFQDLLDRLEDTTIVYVGETHADMDHHDVQLRILEGLYRRDPRLVIGMEMFERTYQSVLDRWTKGEIDQKTFLRDSEWFSRWKFDFSYYERILAFARENGIKILALNAPRELVDKVGDFGINALSPGEKAMIAPIDTSDIHHRTYIEEVFKAHHETPGKRFENFYEAQCVWDDTMAETISEYVMTQEGQDKRAVVLCGAGHIVYKFGIPMRAFRRSELPYATVLPSSLKKMPGEFEEDEKRLSLLPADFIWIAGGSVRERVRLGIVAEKSLANEHGVVVRKVTRGSPAEQAGIQPGDRILAIDEETIGDMVDLRIALSGKAPGSSSRVIYLRGDKRKEVEVAFSESESH